MFFPYKITLTDVDSLLTNYTPSANYTNLYNKKNKEIQNLLVLRELENSRINGTLLQNTWFPVKDNEFHVFLSHSHKDINKLVKFASWLYDKLGIYCFIDSLFWDNIEKIILEFTNLYPLKDYPITNREFAKNLYIMLSNALLDEMNACEAVLFIDSLNSKVEVNGKEVTFSPWINEEINFANKLKHRIPTRIYEYLKANGVVRETIMFTESVESHHIEDSIPIYYQVDLSKFQYITSGNLRSWYSQGLQRTSVLNQMHQKYLKFRLSNL